MHAAGLDDTQFFVQNLHPIFVVTERSCLNSPFDDLSSTLTRRRVYRRPTKLTMRPHWTEFAGLRSDMP